MQAMVWTGRQGRTVRCVVNEDECVDCEISYRAKVCLVDA
jgi:hypothetical protein